MITLHWKRVGSRHAAQFNTMEEARQAARKVFSDGAIIVAVRRDKDEAVLHKRRCTFCDNLATHKLIDQWVCDKWHRLG